MAESPEPYLPVRGFLARSVYNKMLEDRNRQSEDRSRWYCVDTRVLPPEINEKLIIFHEDLETTEFLDKCFEKSDWMVTQLYHLVAKTVLSWFMNNTSINGFLRRGSMFIFSKEQFRTLLKVTPDWHAESLLDLGAGDGMVTRQMAAHFREVFVTETSPPMRWRLEEQGYRVLEIDKWADGSRQYDLVTCLNLLDRCDRPLSILADVRRSLRPITGRAVVAIVLPFSPYVEFSSHGSHIPEQNLLIRGHTFEEQVYWFVKDVFQPMGFQLEALTRLPYLCEGDLDHSYYELSDVVFVLSVKTESNRSTE